MKEQCNYRTERMERDVFGIGCGAHTVRDCVQNSYDAPPVEVEALVVKIYIYFHICTGSVTELQALL
jgi:hypothetical protein